MPHFVNVDREFSFSYAIGTSTAENRFVSNLQNVSHAENAAIIIPSGTAGFELWANNSKPFLKAMPPYMTNYNIDYDNARALSEIFDASFSAHWVNITNAPYVYHTDKTFMIDAPFRFLRLQGSSVSGSSSAAIGYLWSSNMDHMI